MTESEETLVSMITEIKSFFNLVGLEINPGRSATNCESLKNEAELLESAKGYKYLDIIEYKNSKLTSKLLTKIRAEIGKRVREICKTKISVINLFKAINKDAISLINYYLGVLNITPDEFKDLDDLVRKILITHHIHIQPGCKERLYLPREELGRGLISIEERSEKMLLQLRDLLE